ncbi:MAG: hypothetical protein QM606_07030 [Leucobacter sp.]
MPHAAAVSARRVALVAALCGAMAAGLAGLAGCAREPVDEAPEPPKAEVLSASRAGGVYLESVCPVNDAWDAADVELDRLRIVAGRNGEASADTHLFAEAMKGVATASEQAAEELGSKRQEWPAGAKEEVDAVRRTLESDRKQTLGLAKLDADRVLSYAWKGAEETAASAAAARAALGLPEDPVAACAQWEEQRAEEAEEGGAGGVGAGGVEVGGVTAETAAADAGTSGGTAGTAGEREGSDGDD